MERYPQISEATLPVSKMIRGLPSFSEAERMPPGTFELEARLGEWNSGSGSFRPGVSREFFQHTLQLFEQFTDWQHVTAWTEIVDYFYPLAKKKNATGRTSSSVSMPGEPLKTVHIQKHVHDKAIFRCSSQFVKLYDVGVSLNFEETLSPSILPTHIHPTLVRLKTRKRYLFCSRGEEPLWAFDMTRVWSGTTKAEAEKNQQAGIVEPIYEVELECLNPVRYMQQAKQDEIFVAASLLLKITRLFDVEEASFALAPILHQ